MGRVPMGIVGSSLDSSSEMIEKINEQRLDSQDVITVCAKLCKDILPNARKVISYVLGSLNHAEHIVSLEAEMLTSIKSFSAALASTDPTHTTTAEELWKTDDWNSVVTELVTERLTV
eukprot:gene1793-1966_t